MSFKAIFSLISWLACITLINLGCGSESKYPDGISEVLKKAGANSKELEKVLKHYESDPDTLKLQAAYYLIGNMDGHGYATYYLHDSLDEKITFNVNDFASYEELLNSLDSIESIKGSLDFDKDTLILDMDVITADYLTNQIDLAFDAWREKPWAKKLAFHDFCNYVLPYRGSNEPLEDWREYFMDKYNGIQSQMKNPENAIEAASIINSDIRSWFKFDRRYYLHPTDLGLKEMLKTKMGRCEDMTNITIYAMRANGLAVTSDFTPYWANAGNNHAWNAIITTDHGVIPFMGAEANPGDYELQYKFAKVYRKMFAEQPDNLIFQKRKQDEIPGWLSGKSYIDVTPDYTEVRNFTARFEKEVPDSIDISYICVFNSGNWKAIDWARIEDSSGLNESYYTDLAPGIAYLPALYQNEKIVPFGAPFYLSDSIIEFIADTINLITLPLNETTSPEKAASTDGVMQTNLKSGQEYELMVWMNDQWMPYGVERVVNGSITFKNVPSHALYWMTEAESEKEERIFYFSDGLIHWL